MITSVQSDPWRNISNTPVVSFLSENFLKCLSVVKTYSKRLWLHCDEEKIVEIFQFNYYPQGNQKNNSMRFSIKRRVENSQLKNICEISFVFGIEFPFNQRNNRTNKQRNISKKIFVQKFPVIPRFGVAAFDFIFIM